MCLTSVPLVCKVNIEVSWKLLRVNIFDAEEFPNFNLLLFFLGSQWYELSSHDTALVREIILFETCMASKTWFSRTRPGMEMYS